MKTAQLFGKHKVDFSRVETHKQWFDTKIQINHNKNALNKGLVHSVGGNDFIDLFVVGW